MSVTLSTSVVNAFGRLPIFEVGLNRPCNTILMPTPISTVINVDNPSLLDSSICELRKIHTSEYNGVHIVSLASSHLIILLLTSVHSK